MVAEARGQAGKNGRWRVVTEGGNWDRKKRGMQADDEKENKLRRKKQSQPQPSVIDNIHSVFYSIVSSAKTRVVGRFVC